MSSSSRNLTGEVRQLVSMGAIDTDSINTAWGLLEQVRLEGQHYFDPSKRDELAQLARELGEYIYLRTGKLPSTRIELPLQFYVTPESGVSAPAVHLSNEPNPSQRVEDEQPDYANEKEVNALPEVDTSPLDDQATKDSDSSSHSTEYDTEKHAKLTYFFLSQWQHFRARFKPPRIVIRGIDRLTHSFRVSEAPIRAYLTVFSGDVDVGRRLAIYGDTPIGRSPLNAELLFQQEVDYSPISRLHCTITDEEDHFNLRDEDSANGTYLNGERLAPVVPYLLKDGDRIELAPVQRGGVVLLFNVAVMQSEEILDNVESWDKVDLPRTKDAEPRGRF